MNSRYNGLIGALMIAVCVALIIPSYFFLKRNSISASNRLTSQAKEQYVDREFLQAYQTYKILFDSLRLESDPAALNYANAAFMSSDILLNGFYGGAKKPAMPDSALQQLADFSTTQYQKVTSTNDRRLSSLAFNQLGYSAIKAGNVFESESTDSVLVEALTYFKNALKKDPSNDSARYNYELIKKVVLFPETILAQTRALVAEKKYGEAAALLENGMKRDPRLRKQKEFLERIKLIIQIETLSQKKTS